MNTHISRRAFLGRAVAAGAVSINRAKAAGNSRGGGAAEPFDFPLIDFHAHVEGDFSLLVALNQANKLGVKLGLAQHGGCHDPMNNDAELRKYLSGVVSQPVFKGMQADGDDWMNCFSKEAVAELDYVLSDALTFPEKDGRRVRLWTPEAKITDKLDFMERYTDYNVRVITEEPVDIFANPTFLPEAIAKEYDTLWTEKRMRKIIDAAVKYGVAIEINSLYNIPSAKFLRLAKESGVKFSFGSNAHNDGVGKLDYSIKMGKELGLTRDDMFMPAARDQKPILRRS